MDLQNLLKNSTSYKFQTKKKIEVEEDSYSYIAEIKAVSPVKTVSADSPLAIIPFNLGKSEKFLNKNQITKALDCISKNNKKHEESYSQSRYRPNVQLRSPISVDHHFHKKNLSPFSPGVVRIKPRETSQDRTSIKFSESPEKKVNETSVRATSSSNILNTTNLGLSPSSKISLRTPISPIKRYTIKASPKISVNNSVITRKNSLTPQSSKLNESIAIKSSPIKPVIDTQESFIKIKEGYLEIHYTNGDYYKGNWVNNKKEGRGKYYYAEIAAKYKGEFKDDLPWGSGRLIFDSGDVYSCGWVKGFIEDSLISIKYKDSSEYDGEVKNGLRDGTGKIEYINGAIYQGHWEKDQKVGHGSIIYRTDVFFEGYFKNDYTDGPGVLVRKDTFNPNPEEKRKSSPVFIYQNSSDSIDKKDYFDNLSEFPKFKGLPIDYYDIVYMTLTTEALLKKIDKSVPTGKFISGRLTGAGMAKYGALGMYYGNFLDGKKSGYGKMTYTDVEHQCEWFPETEGEYIGEWKDDKRHGQGTMKWINGTKYEGKYNNDRRHNVTGKITFNNGDTYDGGWVEDRMEGFCTIKRKDIIIRGQYIRGSLSNLVKVQYHDNKIYEGHIINHVPHGLGIMKWPNGDKYQGSFFDGLMDGTGQMAYNNGDFYHGNWENGSKNGKGTMVYADKTVYKGEWAEGKRSGEGVLKNHKGGVIKSGFWNNDELIQ